MMGVLFKFAIFLLVEFWSHVSGRVLSPPMFNLAFNKRIEATSTCGEIHGEPKRERYCFLAGATAYTPFSVGTFSYGNDFAELRISSSPTNENNQPKNVVEGGQSCDYCDSSVPELSHPASNMVDGSPRWWQSPPLSRGMEFNEVNITIDLEQEFHVAYVTIIMANSPRPGLWVLERSTDYGKTYSPWQYFAEHAAQCEEFFGSESLQPILDDDSVVCTTEYSQIVPLENGQIFVTLLNNRPNRVNFSHSEKLQKFSEATNVRLRLLRTKTLQGHLMDLNDKKDPTITRRYFYAIKEIEMGGRCVCHGHASTCEFLDQTRSNRLLCRCEHHTCGDQCEMCCPGFEQKKWQPTRDLQVFVCEPCNCFGHSEECEYDEEVDKSKQSLDINGKAQGGGVCKNCRDNTDGINCEKCMFGFYRPSDRLPNATNACETCQCHPHYHSGGCEMSTGRCECRPNFQSPDCKSCAQGFYEFPECKLCDCHLNGTSNEVCLPENGTCPCKANFGGMLCDSCVDGFYQFPDCLECVCEDLGAVSKNCSKDTGHCQCKINYGGKSCEVCADGYFNHSKCGYCDCDHSGTEAEVCNKATGKCFCKSGYAGDRCDKCSDTFYGYPDCKPCECDSSGSSNGLCHASSGQCQCKTSFTGRKCSKCSVGYYGYPKCSACDCHRSGSYGLTCNDNGLCFCKSNFDGPKCDKCKANYYNYPICEECNCDPKGVSHTFYGCDKVPVGELCSCKQRVNGRICNECKPTFWNLQFYNPLGCEECGCNLSGTLSGLSDCNDVTGQCRCKAHVSGRNCVECKAGFYNLQTWNQFGCQPCNCDIGGSYSSICDGKTGQCRCKPRINGINCTQPIDMHYFPTLGHMQYEAEDGRTVDNKAVRYAIDESLFTNFSWRGFAVFSPIQDEILLTVDINKPSVYRTIFHYVNPTMNDLSVGVEFEPTNTYSQDTVKQAVETKLPISADPKSTYISKSGTPYPFVLYPGRWTMHIKTKQRLLLDYIALLPSDYFEGSVLRQDVRNPCLLHSERLANGQVPACKQYTYPNIPFTNTSVGDIFYNEEGVKKTAQSFSDDKLLAAHGPTALIDKPLTYYGEVNMEKPGNYVVVIDYANFLEKFYPVNVEVVTKNDNNTGTVIFHHCPYSELCREVVSKDGQPLIVLSDGSPAKFSIIPTENITVALGSVVAIPQPEWTIDYLLPKYRCIMKNEKCQGSEFLSPPNSIQFDVEAHADPKMTMAALTLPFEVADPLVEVVPLNETNSMLEIHGNVSIPDHYVIAVHYYNPTSAIVDLDVLSQADHSIDKEGETSANAHLPLPYCPSVSGCRSTVLRKVDDAKTFEIRKKFALKFFLKNPNQTVYLDYVIPIPLSSYADDILDPITSQRSAEFLTKCSNLLLENNPSEYTEVCQRHVFSLTADYNSGVSSCDCSGDGSTSFLCEQFGGQCPCKENVIGRQCSMCRPGFYGFPECKACDCQRSQQCDPRSGQCFCPLHVEGQQCDKCKPYAFGYDSLIGCQECECNTHGTKDGTLECDQLMGQCKCKENVGGRKCDKCLPGFYGFPYCYRCSCKLAGAEQEICNQKTAQCTCKENVIGHACESCTQGTYFLEERNPMGCTDCFCFGITSQCQSSDYVKTAIMDMKNWTIANGTVLLESAGSVEYTTSESGDAQPKSIYFLAPQAYLGKIIFSYGGKLTYSVLSQPADNSSSRSMTGDVILQGQNDTLEYWADELPSDHNEEFRMEIDFTPDKWHNANGAFVTRPMLMSVLNSVKALLIKGSYYDRISKAKLSKVSLDSAVKERNHVGEVASNVEVCSCPPGYTGTSCEECDDGYFRVHGQMTGTAFLGSCVPCQCNSHSQKCDKTTGKCFECQHDTEGDRCEMCLAGFYGDPTQGHPSDCRVCPCPHATMQNNFANSCNVDGSGLLRSCECRPGYAGTNCGICGTGWFGDPTRYGDFCQPCACNDNNNLTVPGACDPLTGVCSLCHNHTMGNSCEMCESWFHGNAVEAKNCSECSCSRCGSHHCDHLSGNCHCKPNVEGTNCDKCVANAYGYNSCHGCTMCMCGHASVNSQCDADLGLCTCQPGAVGQLCDKCEQGFWNYSVTGCTKCDCESDLSMGTVCDVQTGQCHCMDGATGPRCDQCVEGYLRIPEHGCRYCDQCVHFLVTDLDMFDQRVHQLQNDLNNVSFIYLTSKRLSGLNDSVNTLQVDAVPFLQNSTKDVVENVSSLTSKVEGSIADLIIKARRSEEAANKTSEKVNQLEEKALKFHIEVQDQVVKTRALVQMLLDLAENLGQAALTNQKREAYVNEASDLLRELQSVNFNETEVHTLAEQAEAEKILNDSSVITKNQTDLKQRINETFQKIELVHDMLIDLNLGVANVSNRALEADNLNDLTKKHPYYLKGISLDNQISSCGHSLSNATELLANARTLLLDGHDYFLDLTEQENILTQTLQNVSDVASNVSSEIGSFAKARRDVYDKVHELDELSANILSRFDGVRSDSHRALQAADSYRSMVSAVNDAQNVSDSALTKANDSDANSQGIADKSKDSNVASMELLRSATKNRATVVNELKNNLTLAKNQILSTNKTLEKTQAALNDMSHELNKFNGNKNKSWTNVVEDAKKVQQSARTLNDQLAEIANELPKLKEKAKGGVSSAVDIQQDIKAATNQIELLKDVVPKALEEYSKAQSIFKISSESLDNVTALFDSLRDKVLKARDLANRIKVGVTFTPKSSLQLYNPEKFSRTSAHTSLSFYFKTRQPSGLLLFLGNEVGSAKPRVLHTDDYMAVEVADGKAKLTYDLGSGKTSISSKKIVSDDLWHKLTVDRTGKQATLTVQTENEDLDKEEGFTEGPKSVLNVHQNLSKFYVGGVPSTAKIPKAISNRHFIGQIEDLVFHGQRLGLRNFALNGSDLAELAQERSQLREDSTDSGIRLNGEGYVEMNRNSWNPRNDANIRFSFKSRSPSGLLFYIGKDKDYMAVEIRSGKILAQFNLGSGVAQLNSVKNYDDGAWHSVEFSRNGKAGKLVMDMDADNPIDVTAPGLLSALDVIDTYYIGGLKNAVPQNQVTKQSFYGCIDKLKLNEQLINLAAYRSAAFVENGCPEKAIRVVSFDENTGGLEFPQMNVDSAIELTLKFKTKQRDALILLILDENQINVFSVTLESGALVLSSLSNGQMSRLKMDYRDLADGAWHYVTAKRDNTNLKMDVDDLYSETGELKFPPSSNGKKVALFFGKLPDGKTLNSDLTSRAQPFVGCVGDVMLNKKLLDFTNATKSSTGVSNIGCPMDDPVGPPATDEVGTEVAENTLNSTGSSANSSALNFLRPLPPVLDDSCVLANAPSKNSLTSMDLAGSRFGLSHNSRMEFDKLPEAFDTKSEFSIQFRATASSGVLFYAANRVQSDYIALYMKNGNLIFSFDSGTGPFSLQSKRRYLDFHWHTAVACRDNRHANLSVDGIVEGRGESSGVTYAVDTHRPFYVGGVGPDVLTLAKKTLPGISTTFGGCLRDFKLNGATIADPSSAYGSMPCSNLTENGLFFGPDGGYAVLQDDLYIGPTFSFEMEIKPRVKNAVLLSIAADHRGDYLTLQLLDGKLKFAVDNGAGPQMVSLSLQHSETICDGHWHVVKIYKTKNLLTISADGTSKFFVIKKVNATDTNTKDPLYLGGVPHSHVNRGLETRSPFHGCIREVNIGKKPRRKKHLDVNQMVILGDIKSGGCLVH